MNIQYSPKNFFNLAGHTVLGIDIINWMRLLYKNRRDLDLRYFPKLFFLTATILLNAPFQLFESLRYNKRIKNTKIDQPVFILGHHRSGTTYLHHVMCRDPRFSFCATYEVLTPNVFLTSGWVTRNILKRFMPPTRPMDNVRAGATKPMEEEFAMGSISQTSLSHGFYFPKNILRAFEESVLFDKANYATAEHWKKHFDFYVKKIAFAHPNKTILFKSPANTGRIKQIRELYPDAKFIHIHRDPYRVYLSTERLFEKILPILGFQRVENVHIEDFILYSYEKMYRKYLDEIQEIPAGNLVELAYENFVNDPLGELQKAYQQIGWTDFENAKPHLSEEVRETSGYQNNSYSTIPASLKARIDENWGFFFERYGYDKLRN